MPGGAQGCRRWVHARDEWRSCIAAATIPAPAVHTSMMEPSALLGTTMNRRERGGVLSGSDGSSSCMGRGGSVVSVLHGRRGGTQLAVGWPWARLVHCHACTRNLQLALR